MGDDIPFCGDSPFWSEEVLTSPAPKFTDCFQTTVLEWIPFFWLVLSVLIYSWVLYTRKKALPLPATAISVSKSLICWSLVVLTLLQLWSAEEYGYNCEANVGTPTSFYYGIAMRSVSLLFLSFYIQYVRVKGVVTCAIIYIYWLSLLVCGIIPLQSKISYQPTCASSILHYVYFALVCVQTVLHSFADKRALPGYQDLGSGKPPCPENEASSLAVFTYLWFTPYVIQAFKHTLTTSDLWEQSPNLKCENAVTEVLDAWQREEENVNRYNRSLKKKTIRKLKYHSRSNGHANGYLSVEETPLLASREEHQKDEEKPSPERKPSLYKVLIKQYGWIWLHGSMLKVAVDVFMLLQPVILRLIISYIERKGTDQADPEWMGYAYAFMFFLSGMMQSLLFKNAMQVTMTLGLRIKTALIGVIYRKSLRMSNTAKQKFTVGEIVNLMSVDCQRIQDSFTYGYQVISFISMLAIGIYEIWDAMGIPTLGCIGFLIFLATLNFIFGKLQQRYQRALLRLKGDRIKLFNEVLGGIKVLKMYGWEPTFTSRILKIRQREIHFLKRIAVVTAFSLLVAVNSPFFMCYTVFLIYILMDTSGHLDAQSAFLVLSVVNILRFSITLVPYVVTGIIQIYVSVGRIQRFLWMEDLQQNTHHDNKAEFAIQVDVGRFTWNRNDPKPTLTNINLKIPEGSLVAVVGPIGCGKSSLISAILGEMEKIRGTVTVKGSIAYVPQEAWIQNLTLRDNILYGNPFKYRKYNKVIEVCAMTPDLKILSGGDMTEIGQKGINLSGGQKQRVSLARAVYSNSDVYLLDDPLSAVDSHVGKDIFKNVVGREGLLKNKTRILVTHGVHWLPSVDVIVVMNNGQITEMGTYDQLLQHNGPFAQFLQTYLLNDEVSDEEVDPEIEMIKDKLWEQVEAVTSDGGLTSEDNSVITGLTRRSKNKKRKRGISASDKLSLSRSSSKIEEKSLPSTTGQLTQEETSKTGAISWKVSYALLKAMGLSWASMILVFCLIFQALSVYSNFWLTDWTEDPYLANTSLSYTDKYVDTNTYYLVVYSVLGVLQGVFVLAWSLLSLLSLVKAMANLHMSMLHAVMKSTMAFFDTTPMGRIMNRFSSDLDVMDDRMPRTFRLWSIMFVLVVSVNVVIIIQTPIFAVALVPVFIVYVLLLKFFLPTARQVKRIESVTRSPVYNHFSETITGASVIRAYQSSERFILESQKRVDTNSTFFHAANLSARWISVIVEFLSNLLVLAAALFAIVSNELNAGDVGLSLTYAVQLVMVLNLLVWAVSEMEMNIVSLERIVEYTDLPSEAEWILPHSRPPQGWPEDGQIDFDNFSTRYRPGLELVLKGINFVVESGEKIGIVGRTGAGKSSLTMSLFRLIESAGGCIKIDGVRIADLGLHDLRSKITILPQDPVIFSGSVRLNLDPLNLFDDGEVWKALECAHLKSLIRNHRDQLQYECGEGGQNLSVGQRQLVCLGRALLHKNKILILDEATAAVDMETDELIQETIRTEFSDCTVVTIAHRLNTIMDYDRVMVMDKGGVAEFDTPRNLLKNTSSIFYGMAKDADLASWFDG